MRLAIIGSRGYPSTYSGYETLVRRLAPYLRDQGDDVTVYGRGPGRGATTVDGIRVVSTAGLHGRSTSTLSHGLTSVLDARRRRDDAALVLNVANGYWLPLLRAARVPTVVNVDGLEWERDKWNRLGKAVFRRGARLTARWATSLVADSRAIGCYWARHFDAACDYIPYGGDVLPPLPTDRLDGLDLEPGRFVLVVARLVPENNVDLVLDAVQALDPGLPTVVVGSSVGPSELERRLTAMARTDRVRWLGHVSDQALLHQLWQHCGLYVHGHSVGGTNPSLLQALGAGSPVVAFDTPYNREVLDGSAPLYADGDELTALMATFFADPDHFLSRAGEGRRIVAERFDWEQVCRAYRAALVRAAQARPDAAAGLRGLGLRGAGRTA